MSNRHLIIDADPIAWRAAFVADTPRKAYRTAVGITEKLVRDTGGGVAVLCFSCRRADCFRRQLFPAYKSSRNGDPPPFMEYARNALRESFKCRERPGLEADDVIGILATHGVGAAERIIIADDKDMMTVPGRHYRPRDRKWLTVSRDAADRQHLIQTLTGDAGDGYPGCPGIGPAKASALLAGTPPHAAWPVVVKAFVRAGQTADDALTMARVARILRADEYDLQGATVRPWSPPINPYNL